MRVTPVRPCAALALPVLLWAAGTLLLGRPPGAWPQGRPPWPHAFLPDLNRAPEHHLRLLPGIGPHRARAIVEERERGGPFRTLDEIERVKGIGPVTRAGLQGLARIREADP